MLPQSPSSAYVHRVAAGGWLRPRSPAGFRAAGGNRYDAESVRARAGGRGQRAGNTQGVAEVLFMHMQERRARPGSAAAFLGPSPKAALPVSGPRAAPPRPGSTPMRPPRAQEVGVDVAERNSPSPMTRTRWSRPRGCKMITMGCEDTYDLCRASASRTGRMTTRPNTGLDGMRRFQTTSPARARAARRGRRRRSALPAGSN